MLAKFRPLICALLLSALPACSSSTPQPSDNGDAAPDATKEDGMPIESGSPDVEDASPMPDGSPCDASDATKPQACLLGGPCSCSDIGTDNRPPICVDGQWRCPDGYTRFEDCRGVPPGPSCDAGRPDGDAPSPPDVMAPDVDGDSGLRCDGRILSDASIGTCDDTYDPVCLVNQCAKGYDALVAGADCSLPLLFETLEYDCNLLVVHMFITECVFEATTKKLVGSRSWSDSGNSCAGTTVTAACHMTSCRAICASRSPWDEVRCPVDGGSPEAGAPDGAIDARSDVTESSTER